MEEKTFILLGAELKITPPLNVDTVLTFAQLETLYHTRPINEVKLFWEKVKYYADDLSLIDSRVDDHIMNQIKKKEDE